VVLSHRTHIKYTNNNFSIVLFELLRHSKLPKIWVIYRFSQQGSMHASSIQICIGLRDKLQPKTLTYYYLYLLWWAYILEYILGTLSWNKWQYTYKHLRNKYVFNKNVNLIAVVNYDARMRPINLRLFYHTFAKTDIDTCMNSLIKCIYPCITFYLWFCLKCYTSSVFSMFVK